MAAKRLSPRDLDALADRLAAIEDESEELREIVKAQVELFGFAPARSEKSRRLEGERYEFTLSTPSTTEIRDAEVEKIQAATEAKLFAKLFKSEVRFKVAAGAASILASTLPKGAPYNLRAMFARAVVTKETSKRLRIDFIHHADQQAAV